MKIYPSINLYRISRNLVRIMALNHLTYGANQKNLVIYFIHHMVAPEVWCGWGDSNSHFRRKQILNLPRLPIPPHPLGREVNSATWARRQAISCCGFEYPATAAWFLGWRCLCGTSQCQWVRLLGSHPLAMLLWAWQWRRGIGLWPLWAGCR